MVVSVVMRPGLLWVEAAVVGLAGHYCQKSRTTDQVKVKGRGGQVFLNLSKNRRPRLSL